MNATQSPQRSGPGCFGYGCLIATVIFCVVMGGIWFFGLRSMRSAVDQYTVPSAAPFPQVAIEADVAVAATNRLNELRSAVREKRPFTAEFSPEEVQALIDRTPWRDWVRVGFSGDEFSVSFSFPLSQLGDWVAASLLVGGIKERALTGSASGRFSLQDGKPKLSFSQLELNRNTLEDLPRGHAAEWIVGAVSQGLESSKAAGAISSDLSGLGEVLVRGGRLVVAVRP